MRNLKGSGWRRKTQAAKRYFRRLALQESVSTVKKYVRLALALAANALLMG
ncbi:MAG: hypothetical protein U5J83_05525 [Bryobacterales bacterium]|nr:hypothetical protein [Bryobacterales bacterium]